MTQTLLLWAKIICEKTQIIKTDKLEGNHLPYEITNTYYILSP
jgi:hypothetical protein